MTKYGEWKIGAHEDAARMERDGGMWFELTCGAYAYREVIQPARETLTLWTRGVNDYSGLTLWISSEDAMKFSSAKGPLQRVTVVKEDGVIVSATFEKPE